MECKKIRLTYNNSSDNNDIGYKYLIANIFIRCITDIKLSKRLLKKTLDKDEREFVEKELKDSEQFLQSDWAQNLLNYLNINIESNTIIKKIEENLWN